MRDFETAFTVLYDTLGCIDSCLCCSMLSHVQGGCDSHLHTPWRLAGLCTLQLYPCA